jgi:hypothetical protein
MNRSKVLSFVLLSLLVFAIAEAQHKTNISDYDGTEWISVSDHFRIGYVAGCMMGLSLMKNNAVLRWAPREGDEDLKKVPLSIMSSWIRAMSAANELSLSNITVGQIKDGLNTFYEDFSTRKIKIIDAIYVVKMQLSGKDPEVIAAQVRYLKMQPIGREEQGRVSEKLKSITDMNKALKAGEITAEELLRTGAFIDKNGENHLLFCYGKY